MEFFSIKRYTAFDRVMLIGGLVMAAGTLLPIVRMPLVGSISYVAGGRGDGMIVLALSGAVIATVLYGYRRTATIVKWALFVMMNTLMSLLDVLSKVQGEAAKLAEGNPFGGLAIAFANNIGFEWGWIPLVGGAMAVVWGGLATVGSRRNQTAGEAQTSSHPAHEPGGDFQNADKLILCRLEEIAQQKPIAGPIASASQAPATFGRRRDS